MITVEMVKQGAPRGMAKQFGKIRKEQLQNTIGFWHSNYADLHFKEFAGKKYRYRERTKKYTRAKQKQKGHQRSLVWSGDLRRATTSGIRLRGTSKSATGRMRVPKYAFIKPFGGKRPAEEIVIVVNNERRKMTAIMRGGMVEQLNKV